MPSEEKNYNWFKCHREMFNHALAENKPWCDALAWLYLVSRANSKPGFVNFRSEYLEVKRGEFITSQLKLGAKFGWGRQRTKTFLNGLKKTKNIDYKANNRNIRIIVLNYNKYQGNITEGRQQTKQQTRQLDDNRPTTGDYKQEYKNKEERKNTSFLIKEYLSPEQQNNFDQKPEFVKSKLKHPANANRILTWLYLMESQTFTNEVELNWQLKKDRTKHAHELAQIGKLSDGQIMVKMRNLKGNSMLSLSSLAMACKRANSKNEVNTDKLNKVRQELSNKMNMSI